MKSKRIISSVLALGMVVGGSGIWNGRAYAAENKLLVSNNQQELKHKAYDLIKNIEKNPTEKDIKELRVLLHDIKDNSCKPAYNYLLNLYIDKNMDKGVSPVDELARAYEKSQKVNSCTAKQNISLNLEGKNLSQEEEEALAQILPIINSFNLKTDLNVKSSEKNKKAQAQGNINVAVNGMNMDMKLWLDMDVASKNPKMKYVIEVPETLKVFMPEEYKDKKYVVYDIEKILKNPEFQKNGPAPDFDKLMNSATNFGNKFGETFAKFIKIADAKYNIVSKGDINKLSSEEAKDINKLYKINLDSEKVIDVIKYALQDEEMTGLIKDYINNLMVLDPNFEGEKLTDKNFKEGINEAIKTLDSLKGVVDLDVSVDVGVNKEGYVVYDKGTIKISVNSNKIMKFFSKFNPDADMPKTNSTYIISFNLGTTCDNINKEIKMEAMPEVNEKNSIDYVEMLMNMVPNGIEE